MSDELEYPEITEDDMVGPGDPDDVLPGDVDFDDDPDEDPDDTDPDVHMEDEA